MPSGSVFISYAHADVSQENWLARLKLYLSQARHLEIWDDSRIDAGTNWQVEIERALEEATAAVLLVGPAFLGSSFVNDVELPRLMSRSATRGVAILPLIVGYCQYTRSSLQRYQSFNDPEAPLESLPVAEQNRILNGVATAVSEHERHNLTSLARNNRIPFTQDGLRDLVTALRKTRTAFRAQVKRRDELVAQMTRRLGIDERFQYERFFVRFFKEMNEDDRFLFQQIRAMTEGPLREGNTEALEVLEHYPELLNRYPRLVELQQHLVFWINKFDRVFSQRPDMCLLYAGVEDGVGYPRGLHDEMEAALADASSKSSD